MVLVHFAEGFEEIEAITIVDVLRRAGIETLMVSVSGNLDVCGSHGISVKTDFLFEDVDYESADMLVLPGGLPGAHNLKAHHGLLEQLKQFSENGKFIGAICAAPYILGDMGLLKGKKATCYPGFEKHLFDAELLKQDAVISGKIITANGAGSAMTFALKLVEVLKSKALAEELSAKMLVD